MTFGAQADEATAFQIMDMAYDAGVNFYDAAEMYPAPPAAETSESRKRSSDAG